MKKPYPSSLKTLGLVLGLLLGLSLGASAQRVIFVDLWKNAAGTAGMVNNYPVWIKLGAPLNYTISGVTNNNGTYMDSIPNITVPTQATFITYGCTGATIVSQQTLAPNMSWYGDTLIVPCSSPKPVLHVFASANQSSINPFLFSFFGGITDSALPGGRLYTYSWNFGDGQSATGSLNTTHTYTNAGTYVACLTVTVSDTLHNLTLFSKTSCVTVVAGTASNCQADFRFSTNGSGAFSFMDSSMVGTTPVGGSVSYGWDFGDGFGANTQSATHTYQNPGIYNVCHWVEVRNALSNIICTDTICKSVNYGSNPGNCTVSILALPNGGNSIQFNPHVSITPQADSWVFSWSFGDNANSNLRRPIHNYTASGTYQVCVTAYALDSIKDTICSSNFCDSVFVGFPINTTCQAKLGIQSHLNPFVFTFIDSSSIPTTATQVGYANIVIQDLNSGKSGYTGGGFGSIFPGHFSGGMDLDSGIYSVCLYDVIYNISTGQIICVARDCKTLTVPSVPSKFCQAEYIVDTTNSYQGNVFIWNTSTPSNTSAFHANSYQWDFGDGNTSNQPFPVHTYANPGVYAVCLTLTSVDSANNICTDTYCDTLGVDSLGNLIYKTTGGFTLNVLDPGAIGLTEIVVDEFAVYPNPANDVVTVAWNKAVSGEMKWQITDLKGALLMRGAEDASNKKEMQLDVSRLKAGVYILSASHKNNPVAHYKLRIN